jgi:chromosome partitioning protein
MVHMTVASERRLGWPKKRLKRFSTGLGWPGEPANPQPEASYPQEALVSRETPAAAEAVTVVPAPTQAPESDLPEMPKIPDVPELVDTPAPLVRPRRGEALPRPVRTRVMVVANQKGGVGKTTTTVNVATALAMEGLRTLVIDLDPQGNASTALGIAHTRGTPSSYEVLVDGVPLAEVSQQHATIPLLHVVPATIDLAGAEIELVSLVARENRLRKAIHAHPLVLSEDEDRYDYVFIDCPPSLGLLTLNALVAGAELFIPIQAEYYALEGLGQLLETVEMVRAHLNAELVVSTILLTMYDARTNLAAGVAHEVRQHFGDHVLRTTIPRSVRVSEAPSYGQSVITYDPGSPGALCYREAARELASPDKSGGNS